MARWGSGHVCGSIPAGARASMGSGLAAKRCTAANVSQMRGSPPEPGVGGDCEGGGGAPQSAGLSRNVVVGILLHPSEHLGGRTGNIVFTNTPALES